MQQRKDPPSIAGGLGLIALALALLAMTYLTAHSVPLGGFSLLIWATLAGGLFRTMGAVAFAWQSRQRHERVLPTPDLIAATTPVQDELPMMVAALPTGAAPRTLMEQDLQVLGLTPEVGSLKEVRRAYWELCASLATTSEPQSPARRQEAYTAYRRLRQLVPSQGRRIPNPT